MEPIQIQTLVNTPISTVWQCWTTPEHILKWNQASDDWHTTQAENDLRVGGSFSSRMEAKDGSAGFDFGGTYDEVVEPELIAYHMDDDRKVRVEFKKISENETEVIETFDPETENSIDTQRQGWQTILENFKKHAKSCTI